MKRTSLIRLGGLVTIVGGGLYVLERYRNDSEVGPPFALLLVAAMAAIASITVLLHRERNGWSEASASLVSFVGLALILWANYLINSVTGLDPMANWGLTALVAGILVATIGLVVLARATMNAGMFPWWGGVALVVGSPLGVLLLMMLPSMVSEALLEGPWQLAAEALAGLPWALVGYALFRAAARRPAQPSRVQ